MNKKILKESFRKGLIDETRFKDELFKLELEPQLKERKPKRRYEGLTEEEFKKLYSAYKLPKHKIILILAYGSGLRLQEILNLKPDDFRYEERIIKIRQGKFSKDREAFIPRYFKKNYISYFPLNLSKMAIQKMFNKISVEIGINNVIGKFKTSSGKERNQYKYHFHCLRHSFAVNLSNKGFPLNYIQKLLGHSNISTTSLYTNIDVRNAFDMMVEKGL
jgi:integrase/recombinase XerD